MTPEDWLRLEHAEQAPAYVSAQEVLRLCAIIRRLDGLVRAAMIPKEEGDGGNEARGGRKA